MRRSLPLVILILTAVLLAAGIVLPTRLGTTVGISPGWVLVSQPRSPEEVVRVLLRAVQRKDYATAYSYVANNTDLTQEEFQRDLAGSDGSLRVYSALEGSEVRPLRQNDQEALVRATMRWSSAVGPLFDSRDLRCVRKGNEWKVVWPAPKVSKVPPQVIPVNYLRWDIVSRGFDDDWGAQNVDSPKVRIISMNAVQRLDDVVIMGEIVNEDTIPAFVDVTATILGANGEELGQETSFDKISHTLLPKQVSAYRIDFPRMKLEKVKKVRMDAKAMLVPASADPVIAVMNQRIDTDSRGSKVLTGELVNQSGQLVNIAQVLAVFYDDNGKVIWVSDGYVDRALLPQTPETFAVAVPNELAPQVHSYRVAVNHYSANRG